ncbi:unnamed protein product [Rotaria sp. Silwood2]|nr:unnamed protein product [Rotaria sp. Silwood2]CAF2683107.1 unnamed protein product [Rotaria sp. Silwood2]CAF3068784.1 unnamed protein product [Rotaria sp. Silwood2]CAF4083694.1 unnamed protein product [Rotaria sp. Silwood2]CAF4179347.1 unnamed protein product [Rotaria sp. Silwood2]
MGRRKRKSKNEHPICTVCRMSYSPLSSLIPRCSSCISSCRNTICDSCLHRYIYTSVSEDITKRIICPEEGCHVELGEATINAALVNFGYQHLWKDYAFRYKWFGTSEQWIRVFAVRCPSCRVPIEKNGGCDRMECRQCHLHFSWSQAKILYKIGIRMNPYGSNPFGVGPSFPYAGAFPQQGFGQFGNTGGFFHSGVPLPGGNFFQGNPPLSPPATGFPPQPIGGQFGQGYSFSSAPGGFGYPPASYMPPVPQPQFGAPFPPEQYHYGNQNYFGSGAYGRTRSRSRHSSRHRSKPRHRSRSSSSSSNERRRRGSPFGHPGHFYGNASPFANVPPIPPRGGSPIIPPRPPVW